MIKIIILVLCSEIITAAGQVLFKKSTNMLMAYDLKRFDVQLDFLKDILSKPSLWAGFACLAAGMVIWIVALAHGDLSLVFSLGSLQYILILFLAHQFLGEKIDAMKCIGTFLVVFGIIIIILT